MSFDPRFCCPECGRAPARDILWIAWQAVNVNGRSGTEDDWMYWPDGRIKLPEVSCINGHTWSPPKPALNITISAQPAAATEGLNG